jgi:hypothetical protein
MDRRHFLKLVGMATVFPAIGVAGATPIRGCKPKPAKISDCSQLGVPRPNRRNLPIVLTGNTCFPTSTLRLQNKTPKSHKKCTGNYVAMLWCTKI